MFNKILVPVDIATALTTQALFEAANEMALKFDAKVQLIAVIPDYGTPLVASFFPKHAQDEIKEETRKKVIELASKYFTNEVKISVMKGSKRVNAILKVIEEMEPDLVMLGCRRKNSRNEQRLLGSTTMAVTDRAQCCVMVIRREVED